MILSSIKRHGTLLGVLVAASIYFFAVQLYPGGSDENLKSEGFDWQRNYFCNLLSDKALNGEDNPAAVFAIFSLIVFCISIAYFYYNHADKIDHRTYSKLIKYCGIASMISASLVFTWHYLFMTSAVILSLFSMFLMIVFLFKEKAYFFGAFGVVSLVILYFTCYVYYASQFIFLLATLQKVVFIITTGWFLCLNYFYKTQLNKAIN